MILNTSKKILSSYLFGVVAILSSCQNSSDFIDLELIPVESGNKYQYVNAEGKILINPQFKNATLFRNGLALVQSGGDENKWGFISKEGLYKIPAIYKRATTFNEELAWVVPENGAPSVIDVNEKIRFTLPEAEEVRIFSEGLAGFRVISDGETKWGFVDTNGKVVINPQFKDISMFSEGLCAVQNDDRQWGYIDKTGKLVISYQFDGLSGGYDGLGLGKFVEGKTQVKSDKQIGVIDKEGRYVINPQFEDILPDGDLYLIKSNGLYGWCDSDGKILINPQFDLALRFGNSDFAPVAMGKKWGYINREGKIEINPQFKYALPFNDNIAIVSSGSKIGIIDAKGKYKVNPQFDDLNSDLVIPLVLGDGSLSEYIEVKTDYFNIPGIVDRINLRNPEELKLESTLAELQEKLAIPDGSISLYNNYYEVFDDVKITNEADLRFRVYYARAYREVQDGWYMKRVFNPNAKISAYEYYIQLRGRGLGKANAVSDAITDGLNGYELDEAKSSKSKKIFTKENQKITIQHGNSYVRITIGLN